jgi:hypothetical protein
MYSHVDPTDPIIDLQNRCMRYVHVTCLITILLSWSQLCSWGMLHGPTDPMADL